MGDLGDDNAVQRRDGALDILDQNKDIVELVARVATEWNADKTFAGLTNAIQAHPDVNLLISPSDSQDAIIEQVLKSAGKWHKTGEEGHVLFSGFDGDQNGYNLLSDEIYGRQRRSEPVLSRSISPTAPSRISGRASSRSRC